MKNKLQVGQTLYLIRKYHYKHNPNVKPIKVTVSKVGRKYFELEGFENAKFNINTLTCNDSVSCFLPFNDELNFPDTCFLSLEDIQNEKQIKILTNEIKSYFNNIKLTIYQLRQIADIIKSKSSC